MQRPGQRAVRRGKPAGGRKTVAGWYHIYFSRYIDMKGLRVDRQVQDILRALASPARQRMLTAFLDGRERTVGEIVDASGFAQSTVSTHLAQLTRSGLLGRRKDGKEVYYKPDRHVIAQFLERLAMYLRACC